MVQQHDKFLIYKINDRSLNDEISFVFKTSKRHIQIALSMGRDGNGCLKEEYAFF